MDNYLLDQIVELTQPNSVLYAEKEVLIARGDIHAHVWRIQITDTGMPEDLSSYTIVSAHFIRADLTTVDVAGSIVGNAIMVTLTEECYAVLGRLLGFMMLGDSTLMEVFGFATFYVSKQDSAETTV